MSKLCIIALLSACAATHAQSEAVKVVRLALPPQADPVVEHIGRVFARLVESRSGAKVVRQGDAALAVELAFEPGIGAEGFRIADGGSGTVRISASDRRGLLYGAGKFLHTSAYGSAGLTPGSWRGVSTPVLPFRGMYLATHFHNFYQDAPVEDVTRYIEELSLWGINNFLVWFGMDEFGGIDDPKAQAMLARLRVLLRIVKDLGLDASLGCICNDGYANSPVELRADDRTTDHPGYHTRKGPRIYNIGTELCPSKPGVPELQLRYCEEKFEAFKRIGLDCWFIAPYDNGGCTCARCAPWGANGYLRMAEPLARAYRRAFPGGKVVLSTWYFDRWADGEWAGISKRFNRQKPDWVDYIMADNFEEYPRYPLDHGVPGGLPLINFPDISMWGQNPWGGYGANPHPGRLQARWDETGRKLAGGIPYSEGIYEDLNKVICAQIYWSPDRPTTETVRDYAAYEFSPEVADVVAEVVAIFEKNHLRNQIGESAVAAFRLLEEAEAKLTVQARSAWRWRLFRIRAAIDQELYRNSRGRGRADVLRRVHEELVKILHAENAWPMLRPLPIPAVNVEGPALPAGYAEAIAASKPAAWWRMRAWRERDLEDSTGNAHRARCENAVTLVPPDEPPPNADAARESRAVCLHGGRIKAAIEDLRDSYSVEFWFYNTLPTTARPVTGYILSRGVEGPEGTPGDDLGISGTSAVDTVPPGRLFFFNGDANAQLFGTTALAPETWHHVVFVRDQGRIAVYLDANAAPELSGQVAKGYPDGVTQLFVGGRNDGFGCFQGRIAEVSVYTRALPPEEVRRHQAAAVRRK